MASINLAGDTSGTITLSAPLVSGSSVQTLAAVTGTLAPVVSGTAVTASGTSVDFTSIPSWVKRITVMFSAVSTNGSLGYPLVQIGSGSVTTSGYVSSSSEMYTATVTTTSTAGFIIYSNNLSYSFSGAITLLNVTGNVWVASGVTANTSAAAWTATTGGTVTLSGVLDRIRVTTTNGTDTFDAGSINILYE